MGFTELTFLFVYFPASIVLYILFEKIFHNDKLNNIVLVFLSTIFYLWSSWRTMLFFIGVVIFTYIAGWMAQNKNRGEKRVSITLPIICLVGVLAYYKYATIIIDKFNNLTNANLFSVGDLIVPIGLSFVIFESISYIVDIYRGDAEAGTFLDCFTFLCLFPKLVSGPIVLWKDFRPQLIGRRTKIEDIVSGIDRVIIGLSKKVIIADTFGAQIAMINKGISVGGVDVPSMWLRTILYFFQLYFDFSGYSDIAIGTSKIFGFHVKENFNQPYLSKSITDFWRRWHISLGVWFREYVYIPLGGNRNHKLINIGIVFILTGLWHGTGIQYLVWGCAHGLCAIFERIVQNKKWYNSIPVFVRWFFTTLFILLAWILFMSKNLSTAGETYRGLFMVKNFDTITFNWRYYLENRIIYLLIISIIIILSGIKSVRAFLNNSIYNNQVVKVAGRILLLAILIVDLMFVFNSGYSPFLYFQY